MLCAGGSLELDAGSGYANYAWSTGETTRRITVRAGGRYIASVDDGAGCTGADTVEVTGLPPLVPLVEADGPTSFCKGDSVTLRTQVPYARYIWLRDGVPTGDTLREIMASAGGAYTVEVIDVNGCRGTSLPFPVIEHAKPEARIQGPAFVCENSTVIYSAAPTGSYAYTWSVNGGVIDSGQGTEATRIRWNLSLIHI